MILPIKAEKKMDLTSLGNCDFCSLESFIQKWCFVILVIALALYVVR